MGKIHLSDAYEKLLPRKQYKITPKKEGEQTRDSYCRLIKSEGCV